ncbi:UDP-glucuronosyltransferase 2A1-like [Hypomesus transpacificus]|uniref:UDP-glucuronosyltransferase 2A1-like n=1 Tax=Hypomesus transpacificus TaxID=137520 RepID=UPI001F07C6D3|nr:UDP-glucuronosyltransferase 2A1-like [Hypomesus transpacificus]
MGPLKVLLCAPLLMLCWVQGTHGGNVLVFPGEFSHWLNIRVMLEALVDRNHSVTVVVNSASPSVRYTEKERFSFKVFNVSYSKGQLNAMSDDLIDYWINQAPNASTFEVGLKIRDLLGKATEMQLGICDSMLRNKEFLDSLRKSKFDVVLADPMMLCSELVADALGLPYVISLRFSFGYAMERLCGQMPAPPSYVPAPPLPYTAPFTFPESVKNFLMQHFQSFLFKLHNFISLDGYYSEIHGKPTSMCEMIGKADIWLIRTYWDFEHPRPFLPNFKFVGGLHCKPAKQLPTEMEEFVQSSGDNGIVVFSLGSMIKNLTKEKGNTIAAALGQIPQKVVWRYSGEKPDTIAPNTRVYDWIPQNDLLGHTKTKAFITHGGTNGLYEAIYHGIPMVGIPFLGDQPYNIMHMKTKGAAVMIDFNTMQPKDLVEGLTTVINDPSYKENMMKLSRIHHDQPMRPLDTAVFWIEFVMRNKGAKHLRVQAHNLTWYQYYCLDVAAFLLSVVGLILVLLIKTCCFCIRKCCGKGKPREKTE